jgi:hypothetical protein
MQKLKSTQKKTHKLIMIIALSFVGVCVYLLAAWQYQLIPFSLFNKTYEPGEQVINMNKTEAEKKVIEDLNNNPGKKLENSQTDTPATPYKDSATGKQKANVLLTNVGISNEKVSASGFVTNISETGGMCEFIFTNGDARIVKASDSLPNSTSTTCKTVSFPSSELIYPGNWSVYLQYTSAGASGTSSAKEFQK